MTHKSDNLQSRKILQEKDEYRELLDQTLLPIVVTDLKNDHVLYLNEAASRFFKVKPLEIVGFSAAIFWEDTTHGKEYVEKVSRKKRVKQFKTIMKNRAGEHRHVLISGHLTTFQEKQAVSTVFEDITTEREPVESLRESEKKYHYLYNLMRLLADAVPDLIWAKDLDDKYLFSNKANNEKLLKCDVESNPIGRNHLYYAERERKKGMKYTFGEICVNSDQIVKRTLQPGSFLEDGLVRDQYLKLDVYKAPLFDSDGTLIGTVGAARDITQEAKNLDEKLASEQRYRLLAENVKDVVWVVDVALKITYVSPSLETTLGYDPERFLNTNFLNYARIFGDIFVRNFVSHFEKLKNHDNSDTDRQIWELEMVRRGGQKIWVEIVPSKLTNGAGNFHGLLCVARDVTTRVHHRKELKKASEDALAASLAKSEFLANMSHEIRTPINGVLGMLQLLKETPLDTQQQTFVETGLQSGTSLLRLISDILDFSKIEAGKIELAPVSFDFQSFLGGVISTFENLIATDSVTFKLKIDKTIPDHVVADKYRLQQILYNLLGNAIKFTSEGVIRLQVESSSVGNGDMLLTFTVADTGIGMADGSSRNLFEPFVQLDGSFQRKYAGAGLGLSIVKQLVTLMQGDVKLRSKKDVGTTVDFTIIARVPADLEITESENCRVKVNQDCPLAILVVEDEKINAMVITAMLEKMGHRVTLATDGKEAIAVVKKEIFDCILMDIQMPGMDGIQTTAMMRKEKLLVKKGTPIIAVTAHAMQGDRENFLAAGMDDYITKPVDAATLQSRINSVLAR